MSTGIEDYNREFTKESKTFNEGRQEIVRRYSRRFLFDYCKRN